MMRNEPVRPEGDSAATVREKLPALVENMLVELVESQVIDIDEFTAAIFETITPSKDTLSGRYIAAMLCLLDKHAAADHKASQLAVAIELVEEIENLQVRERLLAIVDRDFETAASRKLF